MRTVTRNKYALFILVIALCLAAIGINSLTAGGAVTGGSRTYVAGKYMLEIDGVKCGFVNSFSGGNVSAEVIQEPVGPDHIVRKHIGQPKYEDITLQIGMNMSNPVYDWIAGMMTMNYQRKNGAIIACDYNYNATKRIEFNQALITEVTFPACDGASKNPGYITLKIAPEYTRTVAASGKVISGTYSKNEQKMWLPANFRFNIDNLGTANQRVNKIEALTIKQTAVTDDIGAARDYQKEPGKLEFPNIVITTPELTAQPLVDWHKSFVIDGNNEQSQERNGYLELLSPNLQNVLLRLDFKNVGIFRLTPDKVESGSENIRRVKAEMYCEQIMLKYLGDQAKTGGTLTTTPVAPSGSRTLMPVTKG